MNKIKQSFSVALLIALAGMTLMVQAQSRRVYNLNDRQMEQLLGRIETRADRFRTSLTRALDQSRFDNTRREENINQSVTDFSEATSQLRDRFNRRESTVADAQSVLDRAAIIDTFMSGRRQLGAALDDWTLLKAELNQLASAYGITWNWDDQTSRRDPSRRRAAVAARLTGTFRLDTARSDDARLIVERAVSSLPDEQRRRAEAMLLRRLESPEMISIEQNGQSFTLASSRARQASFEADGREQVEQNPNTQRTTRVRATLTGDRLTVSSTGDRASDFTVTFDPVSGGRELRVTRTLYSERLSQPITVQSIYNQVSNVADWNVYTGRPDNRDSNYPRTGSTDVASGDYVVPHDMVLVTRLNTDLDTERARAGDRFTLTVLSPSEYEGATIEGYVGDVNRGGRVTGRAEMALNLESIRLRNGRSYKYEGTIESVRTASGETVRVDNEGSVKEDDSQTKRTVTRTAIGTAIGAILGAVVGGGSGAAVGAVVGAGAGAGSVYVQGRNDLKLMSGTELSIRSSAPRGNVVR